MSETLLERIEKVLNNYCEERDWQKLRPNEMAQLIIPEIVTVLMIGEIDEHEGE